MMPGRMWLRGAAGALVIAVVLGSALAEAVTPVSPLYDDAGRPNARTFPARRVVTLAPSLTELVYAAGAEEQLVGVSAYSDYPEMAKLKPQVADATGVSFEALLALKPDLVLAWKDGTRPADIARLESLGVHVFVLEIRSLADVPNAVRTIGKLTGRSASDETPERFATVFESTQEQLRMAGKGKSAVRVFFEISRMPLMTVNGKHLISETIRLCGGENVFSDVLQMVIEPSREELLRRGADAILRPASIRQDETRDRTLYSGLDAYQDGRIYPLNGDWILRPGPRILLAAEQVCAALDRARMSMGASIKAKQ